VGASTGVYDQGRGESDDTLAVIAWGHGRWPDAALVLAGFSFGGMVALSAAATAAPVLVITVAPAVGRAEFGTIARPLCPWLIVQGDADEIVDCHLVQQWAARFDPPPQWRVLPGAGHFFHGRLHELKTAVQEGVA
jgi:alpha/beta superfamily hydrolase